MQKKFIKNCAITGADNWVSYADINETSNEYPFAEWAMLLSIEEFNLSGRDACRRFPTRSWMHGFIQECPNVVKTVHLCGDALRKFIEENYEVEELLLHVRGIQLNFKFREGGRFLLTDRRALERLVRRVELLPHLEVILQYGGDYQGLAQAFRGLPNISILIDGSAGSGKLPTVWPRVHPHFPTGYAGGLNPSIVAREIGKIYEVVPPRYVVTRVDAETGYRDKEVDAQGQIIRDEFSIPKARQLCEAARPFIIGMEERYNVAPGRHTMKPDIL